jgi:polynucleotide 5'-kinase involved in rRNA processing
MPTPIPRVTPPPITTPNDLDRSLLDSSPPEVAELREATSLINSIDRSSTLETPVKRYIKRSGAAFERITSENPILRKENTEFRELSRVRKERKKGKRVAIKGKFVFNTKEILELTEEVEVEASKGKSKRRRTTRATTPVIEDEEEEGIEESIYESESDCIIVASSRSKRRSGV